MRAITRPFCHQAPIFVLRAPPLYKEGGPNDIIIDQIPICNNDPDNVDCGRVFMHIRTFRTGKNLSEGCWLSVARISKMNCVNSKS